jgi:hypothetical protein
MSFLKQLNLLYYVYVKNYLLKIWIWVDILLVHFTMLGPYNHHFMLYRRSKKSDTTNPLPSLENCLLGLQVVVL